MHQESEMGIAAHFAYKETSHTPAPLQKKKLRWIDDLKEFHSAIKNPNKFLDQLRTDLFKNRIFVFTPQGDVIDLPEHASPVDFAYAVHSDIGSTLSSARVNGKMAALGTSLNNGDIVEIITNKNAKPSSKWLDYAKTGMAKRRIRSYIAEHGGLLEKFLAKE
jgi:(p)ppGpp synthase/HD superfamily hydrolase